jgi:hypothetical protein
MLAWLISLISVFPQITRAEEDAKFTPRIAVLSSLSDVGSSGPIRWWLAGFDAALQAELLENWDVVMLSRAGLSNIIFEQKLAIARGESDLPPQVPAADYLVFSILDSRSGELRMHVMKVGEEMELTPARVVHYGDFQKLGGPFAKQIAAELAKELKLKLLPKEKKPSAAPRDQDSPALKIALLNPLAARSVKEQGSQLGPLLRANLEIALATAPFPFELVERERVTTLMDELALGESGATDANGAAKFGRMVGADLILMPYVHPAPGDAVHVTVLAIDSTNGRIMAGRSWTSDALAPPPAAFFTALSNDAVTRRQATTRVWPGEAAMRHAEARFLGGLPDASLGLRASRAVRAELALGWASSALALSHDEVKLTRSLVGKLIYAALPYETSLEIKYHAELEDTKSYIDLKESGILAEIQQQARRIFAMPLAELLADADSNTTDLGRMVFFECSTGHPQAAVELVEKNTRAFDDLIRYTTLRGYYAKALVDLGRYQDCMDLLSRFASKHLDSRFYFTALDAMRALGDTRREFEYFRRTASARMKTFRLTDVARFLELSAKHGKPNSELLAYSYYTDSWTRDSPLIRGPLVSLRIAAGQKERAISDGQCAYLSYRIEKDEAGMKRMSAILKELDAEPLDSLPQPADFIRLAPGTRLDLIHDQGIPKKRAETLAQLIADLWDCEVHVIPFTLDITRVAGYRQISRSVDGRGLANALMTTTRSGDNLFQSIFLTSEKLHSGEEGKWADIFGSAAAFSAAQLTSSYYFDRQSNRGQRTVEDDLAIACSLPLPWVHLRDVAKNGGKGVEWFAPMPPDMFATSRNLTLDHRLPGVSPDTGRRLAEVPPEKWGRLAAEARSKALAYLESKPPQNAEYFLSIAQDIAKSPVTIIKPK